MKIQTKILSFLFLLIILSCQKREWNNPFDPECSKEIWTPTDFASVQQGNEINLTWVQAVKNISEFRIERKIEGETTWTAIASPEKTSNTYTDQNITGGKLYEYRIIAVAGSNASNFAAVQIKPLLTATLTTAVPSAITATSALVGGTITSDGGAPITERGVCWATTTSPTTSNNKLAIGNGTGSFSNTIAGLTANSTYYLRAYAINSQGTTYGNELNFSTPGLQSVPAYVPTTGLVGWWPFNGNANDESGNGNGGTVNGATLTADRFGNANSAYNFNSNKITTNCTGIQGNGARSISFWYNLNQNSSNTEDGVMVGYGENGSCGGGWSCSISGNKPLIDISTSYAVYSLTASINNWYFYCITYDPSFGSNTLAPKIYINGALQTAISVTNSTGCSINTGNWNTLTFGGYSNPLQYFNGKLDDIGIWNRALTQQEITNLYNSDGPVQSGTVTDIDGNLYHTVTIGNQVWMVENLKVTKYNDGTIIPYVTDNTTWAGLITDAYCWYNNDATTYKNTYGGFYNWYAVNTGKLAPTGWHVPSDSEWTTLTTYLGGESISGGKLKETGTIHWQSPNAGATNETGFTALPAGYRFIDGTFYNFGVVGTWWTSTEGVTNIPWNRTVYNSESGVYRTNNGYKDHGLSVRCVKD